MKILTRVSFAPEPLLMAGALLLISGFVNAVSKEEHSKSPNNGSSTVYTQTVSETNRHGKKYDSAYRAAWMAANYANENDAIAVIIVHGSADVAALPEDVGEQLVQQILSFGESARYFIAYDKKNRPGYTISFLHLPKGFGDMNLDEAKRRIEEIVTAKRAFRQRQRDFTERLLNGR